jgi:dTDP-4-amino-4,6-dideoxygalactose transaminase
VKVPFLDVKAQLAHIRPEVDAAVRRVFDDTSFILREGVSCFEEAFARYIGRRHCVGVNSGTSALHLALLVAGVRPGDEVVTTPYTWISTSWAVSYCGARPVFADVDPRTGNLDPAAAERAITARTKALLPVDLYGNPADLAAFEALAARHGIALIEDAAQAHGARLHGRPAGSFGLLACFSFYPGKNLGAAGEGGAVVTDDGALAERMRRLRDHAQAERHHHVEIGYNYRMEGLQGAVLDVKLRHLERWNRARRAAADRYHQLLDGIPGVTLPTPTPGAEPAWHLYVVRLPHRNRVAARLAEQGIETAVHYPTAVHLQPAYAPLGYRRGDFPAAEAFAAECLSLPMFAEITPDQQVQVATALRRAVADVRGKGDSSHSCA